jgi:tRNA(Ile)-lysidine synthase
MDVVLTSPGRYVVAVSGGVDSMALLHALHARNTASADRPWKLVVAHLDHGMRSDSLEDRQLVQTTAKRLGLPFVYDEVQLGAGTSEAVARAARYDFLHRVQREHNAKAIVTAHHQDDVLETAIINLLRGSGRKGLTSLASHKDVERPLLNVSKRDLIAYAKEQGLTWREDSTNHNTDYLRNYVRYQLLPRFDDAGRRQLWEIITGLRTTNTQLDKLLTHQLTKRLSAGQLDRSWFVQLPHAVAQETMASWLRSRGLRDFDSKTLERLVVAAKTATAGKTIDVLHGTTLAVGPKHLALAGAER